MKLALAAALALLATAALADEPATLQMPSSDIAHAIQILRAPVLLPYSGSRAEQDALSDKLLQAAQASIEAQKAAAQKPPAPPAEPKP